MQIAARSYLTAGVALVGAGAIAISPVAPPLPDVHVPSVRTDVQLSALANPTELFGPVIEQAIANLESLAERIADNPAPILEQVLANQLDTAETLGGIGQTYVSSLVDYLTGDDPFSSLRGNIQTIIADLEAGNFALAFGNAAVLPILLLTGGDLFGAIGMLPQIVGILQQPFDNISNAIGAVGNVQSILPIGLGALVAINGVATALGTGLETFTTAIQNGDPESAVNALLTGAADALGSLATGLLASGETPFENGIIGGLLLLREAVAGAIAPPATMMSTSAAPDSAAVQLAAAANPLGTLAQVIGESAENIALLGQTIAANPAPLLQQVVTNQLANAALLAPAVQGFAAGLIEALEPDNPAGFAALLGAAFDEIASGNLEDGVPAIFSAVLQPVLFPALSVLAPVGQIATQTGANIASLAEQVLPAVAQVGIGALSPVFSGFAATGAAGQAVVDAVQAGDLPGAVAAMLDVPGVAVGGVLNGHGFDAGLLSEFGLVAGLLRVRQGLADAIAPEDTVLQTQRGPTVAVNEPPSDKASFVTVTTEDPDADAADSDADADADAKEQPDDAADTADDSDAGKANGGTDLTDGNKAVPGKAGTSSKPDRANPLKQVRDDFRSTVKNLTDGFKKAAEGLSGKSGKTEGSGTSSESSDSAGSSSDAA